MKVIRRLALGVVTLMAVAVVVGSGLAWHQGYRLYIVHTGSMEPTLRPGDAVLDAPAPASVHVGEVVTFRYPSGPDTVVTHRVASSSGDIVHTKGDANRTADPWTLHLSQVVGTQVTPLPRAGYVLVYLKQPAGLASLVTTVLGLVLLWRVFFPDEGAAASEEPRHRSPARPESAAAHPLLSGGPVG